jgi:hypothetical protein
MTRSAPSHIKSGRYNFQPGPDEKGNYNNGQDNYTKDL